MNIRNPISVTIPRTHLVRIVALSGWLLILGSGLLFAEKEAKQENAFDLPAVTLSLGAEDFATRAAAEKKIQAWAEKNKPDSSVILLTLHDAIKNPEIRMRLFRVLRGTLAIDLSKGFLGIQMANNFIQKGAPQKNLPGVTVTHAVVGKPAAKAGIKRGDVITHVDHVKTDGLDGQIKLRNYVTSKKAGEKVQVHFLREGIKKEVAVILANFPKESRSNFDTEKEQEEHFQNWLNKQRATQP